MSVGTPSSNAQGQDTTCTTISELTVGGSISPGAPTVPGDSETPFGQGDASLAITVEQCDLDPTVPAEVGHSGEDGSVVTVSDPVGDPCVDWVTPYSPDLEVTYSPYCMKWRGVRR